MALPLNNPSEAILTVLGWRVKGGEFLVGGRLWNDRPHLLICPSPYSARGRRENGEETARLTWRWRKGGKFTVISYQYSVGTNDNRPHLLMSPSPLTERGRLKIGKEAVRFAWRWRKGVKFTVISYQYSVGA
jgi:hypothetical protein